MSGGVSYYTVTVPEFVRPGDTFPAMVNGELIQVRCPMNAGPNVKLNIKVVSPPIMYAQYTSTSPPSDSVSNFNRVWIFMDLVLLVLFILSISLTKFAIQRVNSACNVLNPNNGNQLNQLYYHLYSGLGSTETCSVTGSNFCLRWSNTDIWDRFASETNANFYFSGSSVSSSWTAAQVLLPFACAFVLLALIIHCAVEKVGASIETKLRCLIWGGNLVMLSWIVGLFSINFSANSASASASAWESFYSSGHNIVNLLDSNAPVGPPNAGCSVGIFLTGAGIALSIALPVAFFMSISILISACCFLSVYSFDTGPSSGSLYRPGSYGVSGVPRASTGAREYHVTYSEECRMEDVPSYQNQSAPAPVTRTIVHTETKEGGTGTAVAQPYGSTSLA